MPRATHGKRPIQDEQATPVDEVRQLAPLAAPRWRRPPRPSGRRRPSAPDSRAAQRVRMRARAPDPCNRGLPVGTRWYLLIVSDNRVRFGRHGNGMRRRRARIAVGLTLAALGGLTAVGVSLSASGRGVNPSATRGSVIRVTAGSPSELAYSFSKVSLIPAG